MRTFYPKNLRLSARTFAGLEPVLANELRGLGARKIREARRAVTFEGDQNLMYRALIHCRTALRIHRILLAFRAFDEEELYGGIAEYDWGRWMRPVNTLAIDPVVHSDIFRHSHFAAQKAKDAIVDRVRMRYRQRPSVDVDDPDYRIQLRIDRDRVEVALDASGDSLHKRGYRTEAGQAPINEVLAAGMLKLAGYKGERPFADLFCGSGTIAIEAGLIATRTAPGLLRESHGCMRWRDADQIAYEAAREEARMKRRRSAPIILATDKDQYGIGMTERNAKRAGLSGLIEARQGLATEVFPPASEGLLVSNPPYGERMDEEDLVGLYKALGDNFKQNWTGWSAWLLSSSKQALGAVGLRTSKRLALRNGALDCKFHRFDLYTGTKKVRPAQAAEREVTEENAGPDRSDQSEDA
jgi:putative N6-adenine-specific DNA methylase